MNKRRIISLLIAGSVILTLFAGCNKNEGEPTVTTEAPTTTAADTEENTQANTEADTEAPADTAEGEQGGEETNDNTVSKIADAIKAAYGDNYLPSQPLDNEMINAKFGLEEGSYTEAFAEVPMISAQVDMLLIVKAAEGKGGDVKAKLDAYRQILLDDTMQYPMNVPKIEASQVVQNGDYVAFILLGGYDDDNPDATDEDMLKYAEEQTKIGVDAFNSYFE